MRTNLIVKKITHNLFHQPTYQIFNQHKALTNQQTTRQSPKSETATKKIWPSGLRGGGGVLDKVELEKGEVVDSKVEESEWDEEKV